MTIALARVGLLCVVACSSNKPRPPPPIEDAAASPPVAPRPQAPEGNTDLHAMQARLGASATTCFGTAQILADQGNASAATVKWRQTTVQRLCLDDKWPDRVRECAATADHDPLSCTAYLETDRQRAHWNLAFDKWVESAGH